MQTFVERYCHTKAKDIPQTEPIHDKSYVDEDLNDKVELFLERVIEIYINSWYATQFDNDTAFLAEIKHHLCYGGRQLLHRIRATDVQKMILEQLLPLILLHLDRVSNCELKKEEEILRRTFPNDLHYSVTSDENMQKYMNTLAEKVLKKVVDMGRVSGRIGDDTTNVWPSKSGLHLLEDLVVNFLFHPLFDFASDPDNLNRLFLQLVDGGVVASPDYSHRQPLQIRDKQVTFLNGLEQQILLSLQDSLIQVKLGDIIKDGRLLQTFELFLEDFNGPAGLLQILKNLGMLHKTLQKIERADDYEMVLREVEFDCHQLYATWKNYKAVADNHVMPLKTNFLNEAMFKSLKHDLDDRNVIAVDKMIEDVYRNVYETLSKSYLTTFCQSEYYFGYLSGSPPQDIAPFIEKEELKVGPSGKILENSFSFSSFRNRVWSVMIPSGGDELEGGIDVFDNLEMNPTIEIPIDEAEYKNMGTIPLKNNGTKLSIRIEDIETRKDLITTRPYYLYAIAIISTDISALEPVSTEWVVLRKPEEFYTLEAKLVEFHGSVGRSFEQLPPKKSFTCRDRRMFLDNLPKFEAFLNHINQHILLKNSELFYSFLSSPDEFKDTITLGELNPWRAVKKVPQKLSRERGQNLKSFILNSLSNIMSTPSTGNFSCYHRSSSNFDCYSVNDNLSVSSNIESEGVPRPGQNKQQKGHPNLSLKDTQELERCLKCFKAPVNNLKLFDLILLLTTKSIHFPKWLYRIILLIESIGNKYFSETINAYLTTRIKAALSSSAISSLISSLHTSLFDSTYTISTPQEKDLRKELSKRKFMDLCSTSIPGYNALSYCFEDLPTSLDNIFDAFQHPKLNRHLVVIVMDRIIEVLFKEN
uniref:Sorting nexin-14 n=1 Tax=Rhabditophanes sp. KR3021 TaxID=114890 RepID=A0AC35U9F8_9BILA